MKKALLVSLALWALVSVAWAIERAVVVTSITYTVGETRPVTLNTDGELRVSCD